MRRLVVSALLVLVLVLAPTISLAQTVTYDGWSKDLTWDLGISGYQIDTIIDDDEDSLIVVVASNASDSDTGVVKVLAPNFTELESYNITMGHDFARDADIYGDIIAIGSEYGSVDSLIVINRTSGSVTSAPIQSVGGTDYNVDVVDVAIVGNYVYVLVTDEYDFVLRIHVFDVSGAAPTKVTTIDASSVDAYISRIENSNYLVYWNGSTTIYVLDGTDPSLATVVASIDVGTSSVRWVVGYYNDTDNTIVIAFAVPGSNEYRFIRYDLTNGTVIYDVSTESPSGTVSQIRDFSGFDGTVYLVTFSSGGYRILDAFTGSPTIVAEALPYRSFVHLRGSEYLYALDDTTTVARYVFSPVVKEVVTETVTQPVVQYETETVTETEIVQGPYTQTDLVLVGVIALIVGVAIAYVLQRR